jgi:hypothetical protein
MNKHIRFLLPLLVLVLQRCGGSPVDSGGTCYLNQTATTSTITATGFEAYEGEEVRGCFRAAQSFSEGCDRDRVADGGFSLTAVTCTGVLWDISILDLKCDGLGAITPAQCYCGTTTGKAPRGVPCDAGRD